MCVFFKSTQRETLRKVLKKTHFRGVLCIIKQNLDKIRPKIIKNPTSKMLNSVG